MLGGGKLAGGGDVGGNLAFEGGDVGELLFTPEFLAEDDFQLLPVDVAAEIEEVDFENALVAAVGKRGASAEVDDAGHGFSAGHDYAGEVDAVGREGFPAAGGVNVLGVGPAQSGVNVGGGVAELVADAVAFDDGAANGEGAAEHDGGAVEVAVENVLADGGGADHFSGRGADGFDFGDGEAVAGGELFEEDGVAGAVVAKVEPGADADVPAEGDLGDELFRSDGGEGVVKMDEDAGVKAELFDEGEFVGGGGEQGRRLVGTQDAERVGVECQRDGESVGGAGGAGLVEDALVAEVDAVKDADGEGDRAVGGGEFGECAEDFHRTKRSFHFEQFEDRDDERDELVAFQFEEVFELVGVFDVELAGASAAQRR